MFVTRLVAETITAFPMQRELNVVVVPVGFPSMILITNFAIRIDLGVTHLIVSLDGEFFHCQFSL